MTQSHNENTNSGHITTKNYLTGFALATVLTIISFGLVMMNDSVSKTLIIVAVFASAILQMLVHLYYFLHLNNSKEQRWNLIAISFTALLMFIFVGGTIWVMYTLNLRMM